MSAGIPSGTSARVVVAQAVLPRYSARRRRHVPAYPSTDFANAIIDALAAAGLKCWADKAYQGVGRHVRVLFRGRRLKRWKRRRDSTHAKVRCLGEQAMVVLKGRRLQLTGLLLSMRDCRDRLPTDDKFAVCLAALRADQKRKRSLMRLLDQHGL
ncbi:hypothetical protein [Streptomyces fagopyri]|uniref:hypothetical protein n=1 Tax=Streptomyces fagopyri TaxID=2662397 RepID=UPI0033DE6702